MLQEVYQDMVDHQTAYKPEIALIYDEKTYFWLKSDCQDLTRPNAFLQRSIFQSCGAPVGYYYINDLAKIPDSAKLFIFVNTFRTTPEEDKLIEGIKQKGRTLLWLYAPGYVTEKNLSKEHIEKLTGFPLLKREQPLVPDAVVSSQPNLLTKGLEGAHFGTYDSKNKQPIAPTFYGDSARGGFQTLATYAEGGQPALLFKRNPEWTSIYCATPIVSIPLLRAIAREAGVSLIVDGGPARFGRRGHPKRELPFRLCAGTRRAA